MLLTNGLTNKTKFIGPFPSGVQLKMILSQLLRFLILFSRIWQLLSIFIDVLWIPVDGCIQRSCRISFTAYFLTVRSICSKMFFNIGVLKNFAIFTGKHLCWRLFLIRLQAFSPVTFLKRDSYTDVFLWILQNSNSKYFFYSQR